MSQDATWLAWLADAPLFIDAPQVEAFHDAILRPRYKTLQVEMSREWIDEVTKNVGGNFDVKLPAWFPWLKAEAGVSAQGEKKRAEQQAEATTLEVISNPTRKLVELSLHYLAYHPSRIWAHIGHEWELPADDKICDEPRMLSFIEFPRDTKFLPMAAELGDGCVVKLFEELAKAFGEGEEPPKFPGGERDEKRVRLENEYWRWFDERWDDTKALHVLEDCVGTGGRLRWVDYTVPVHGERQIHLHVVSHGDHDTGTFAYNFIRRGYRHGVRVAGRVKTGADVNVLAIYEI